MAFATTLAAPRSMMRAAAATPPTQVQRLWGVFVLGAVLLLGLFYLIETNAVATKGYEIKALDTKLNGLRQASQRLEVQSAQLQSMGPGVSGEAGTDFVAVEHIEYLGSQPDSNVGLAVR